MFATTICGFPTLAETSTLFRQAGTATFHISLAIDHFTQLAARERRIFADLDKTRARLEKGRIIHGRPSPLDKQAAATERAGFFRFCGAFFPAAVPLIS
jgi:hypothetical protein